MDSEPQTVEEAFVEWWYGDTREDLPPADRPFYHDGFIAGAAWARTPTLPAGATEDLGELFARAMFYAEFGHTGLTWDSLSEMAQDEWERKAGRVLESWWRVEKPLVVLDLARGVMWWTAS